MTTDEHPGHGLSPWGCLSRDPCASVSIRGSLRLLLVGLALSGASGCGPGPVARGRTLGEWLDSLKRSTDAAELKETAAALAEMGPSAEPAAWELVRLLSDRQAFGHYRSLDEARVQEVYGALAKALRAIGPGAAPVVVRAMEHGHPVTADVVTALHDAALPELANALAHPSLKVRRALAERWRDLGARGRAGGPMLVRVLRDADAVVRREAAKSLGAISADPETAVPALAGALGDEAPAVRLAVVESLGAFPDAAAVALPALMSRLGDEDAAVSAAAAAAVARFPDRKDAVVPLLAAALADAKGLTRRAAMRAAIGAEVLALLPPRVLVPFIEPSGGKNGAVQAEDEMFSVKSVEALLRSSPKSALFVPGLVGRLRQIADTSTAPRQDALAKIGAPAAPVLARMLSYAGDSSSPSEREAGEAEVVRYEAAMGLAAIGGDAREALPVLQERIRLESSEHVRGAVIEAMRRIRSAPPASRTAK